MVSAQHERDVDNIVGRQGGESVVFHGFLVLRAVVAVTLLLVLHQSLLRESSQEWKEERRGL